MEGHLSTLHGKRILGIHHLSMYFLVSELFNVSGFSLLYTYYVGTWVLLAVFFDLMYLVSIFPTRFLFDENCADYKYYVFRLAEEEKLISQTKDSGVLHSGKY
jgi:hypothetical protein